MSKRVLSGAPRLLAAYGCLAVAWAVALPPFSGPDEWSHYLRALGIAHGQLLGAQAEAYHDANLDPRQEAWVAQAARWIDVPPGMAPDGYGCNAFKPTVSAACADRLPPPPAEPVRRLTVQGTYQPAAYLLPALLVRAGRGPVSGLLFCRIANVLTCLVLLATAAWALRPHLLGLVAAVTPMAVFIGAALNPSGAEIAGAIAFTAGSLALGRGGAGAAAWMSAAAGGAALCLSRPLGPLWLAVLAGECVALCGPGAFRNAVRSAPRSATLTAAAIVLAGALNWIWEQAYGPHLSSSRSETIRFALRESVRTLPRWIREQVGVYQYLDSPMPGFAYVIWTAVVLALVVAALRVGARSERVALAIGVVIALLVPVVLEAFVMRPIGWTIQGRHVLPLSVAIPMIGAEVLARHGRPLARPSFAAAALCAFVQLVGFYSDGRRSAVGNAGSWLFPLRSEWSPPFGWWPWLLLACVGAALMATARPETT